MLTTSEVAKHYGISPSRVNTIARSRKMTPRKVFGRTAVWSTSQVRQLKPGKVGRPTKGKDHA